MKHDNSAHKLHLNKLYGKSAGEGHGTYALLESIPEAANRDFTIAQVERGHRYGIPYPVSADHTARKYGNPYER